MEEPTKSDFKSAYEAGRLAIENRKRPFSLLRTVAFAVVFAFVFEVSRNLGVRFSLSWFEKSLINFLAGILVMSVYLVLMWRLPLTRNRISKD
jgi:hypothetical protein